MTTQSAKAFAPATVANVGPGYDVLGFALSEPGDVVSAVRAADSGVTLTISQGPAGLPTDHRNTARVAAEAILQDANAPFGVALTLEKGLPIGSGLGSSGASAVAAAVAVNALLDRPLSDEALIDACAAAEAAACGSAHRDNVAPALLGGMVAVSPSGIVNIPLSQAPMVALITPQVELPTREARAQVPSEVPIAEVTANLGAVARLVAGMAAGDHTLIRGAIDDRIAEPRRKHLIPCFEDVREAAMDQGALGCSISGAGPTIFALVSGQEQAEVVAQAMARVYQRESIEFRSWTSQISTRGARLLD